MNKYHVSRLIDRVAHNWKTNVIGGNSREEKGGGSGGL